MSTATRGVRLHIEGENVCGDLHLSGFPTTKAALDGGHALAEPLRSIFPGARVTVAAEQDLLSEVTRG